jgi:hypothetical protein
LLRNNKGLYLVVGAHSRINIRKTSGINKQEKRRELRR